MTQESSLVTLKRHLQGGTGFNTLRVQFWASVESKHVPERVKKWTPVESKVVPSGGAIFGPLILSNLLKRCKSMHAENCNLKQIRHKPHLRLGS